MKWNLKQLIPNTKIRRKLQCCMNQAVQRCYNIDHPSYPRYGMIGVTVHPIWIVDRITFAKHLMTLNGWDNLELQLDRIKASLGYIPNNLRFVTGNDQSRNRHHILKLRYRGTEYLAVVFWEQFCMHLCKYRHIQNLVRYWKDITGEQILERLSAGIIRSNPYAVGF